MRNRIGKILHDLGVQERAFAREIGLEEGHFNRIKNGRQTPGLLTALRIAQGLGWSVEAVFWIEENGDG